MVGVETMAFVVVSIGGEEISRHPLAGPTVMGRSVDADISVRDASMSRWHCRFDPPAAAEGEVGDVAGWVVVDLGSRNGTTVNGRKVGARQVLHHGDLLRIGRVTVSFSVDEYVPAGEAAAKPGRRRAAEPAGQGGAEKGFARPLLVPKTRLPRPDPGTAPARRATTSDLEMMSSPGWSRQLNGRKAPSPSVDHLPGEGETQKTIDLHEVVVNGRRGQNAGMWTKFTRVLRRWLGR